MSFFSKEEKDFLFNLDKKNIPKTEINHQISNIIKSLKIQSISQENNLKSR